jgi:hypothetical protein
MLLGQSWEETSMRKAFLEFHEHLTTDALARLQGRVQILDRMKPVWAYLCHTFEDPLRVYRKIRKTHTIEEYLAITSEIIQHFPIRMKSESFSEKNPVLDGNYQ